MSPARVWIQRTFWFEYNASISEGSRAGTCGMLDTLHQEIWQDVLDQSLSFTAAVVQDLHPGFNAVPAGLDVHDVISVAAGTEDVDEALADLLSRLAKIQLELGDGNRVGLSEPPVIVPDVHVVLVKAGRLNDADPDRLPRDVRIPAGPLRPGQGTGLEELLKRNLRRKALAPEVIKDPPHVGRSKFPDLLPFFLRGVQEA